MSKEPASISPGAFANVEAFVAAKIEKVEQQARDEYQKFKAQERIDNIHKECGYESRRELIRRLCEAEGIDFPKARAKSTRKKGRRILTDEEKAGIVKDFGILKSRKKVAEKWIIAPGTVYAVVKNFKGD